jgi:hypothetical protein
MEDKVHYHIHKSCSLDPSLSQVNLDHNKMNLNIILHSKRATPSKDLHPGVRLKCYVEFRYPPGVLHYTSHQIIFFISTPESPSVHHANENLEDRMNYYAGVTRTCAVFPSLLFLNFSEAQIFSSVPCLQTNSAFTFYSSHKVGTKLQLNRIASKGRDLHVSKYQTERRIETEFKSNQYYPNMCPISSCMRFSFLNS